MEHYDHKTYGKMLSEELRLFREVDDPELIVFHTSPNSDSFLSISQRLSNIAHPVLVSIMGFDADFSDKLGDTLIEKAEYFFMILLPAQTDDADSILEKQYIAHQNALQIQAKMICDSHQGKYGLDELLISTCKVRSIGPVADNLYGVIFSFSINTNINYQINTDYWV